MRKIVFTSLLFFSSTYSFGQFNFDYPMCIISGPSMHKTSYAHLFAKTLAEEENMRHHNDFKEITLGYKAICDTLNMYSKAFGWVEAVFTGLKSVTLIKTTYDNILEKKKGLEKLVNDYKDKCLLRKNLSVQDTCIYGIGKRACDMIIKDCKNIYKSFSGLLPFAAGMKCTTERLISIMDELDESLQSLNKHLDAAYFQLYMYITSRTNMWKDNLRATRSKVDVGNEALARWTGNLNKASKHV